MNLSPLSALSPLDGRYAAKVAALRPLLSEYGLMHRRVQVEVEWFIALSDAGFAEFKPLTEAARGLLRSLVLRFSEADAQAIKDIERTTNHDVKAVEYWLKGRFEAHVKIAVLLGLVDLLDVLSKLLACLRFRLQTAENAASIALGVG